MKPLWHNVFGEPVDLDDIDREYALNILTMHVRRKARQGWDAEDFRSDELTQKLRDVILNGRDKDGTDALRAEAYNKRNAARGLPFRAKR